MGLTPTLPTLHLCAQWAGAKQDSYLPLLAHLERRAPHQPAHSPQPRYLCYQHIVLAVSPCVHDSFSAGCLPLRYLCCLGAMHAAETPATRLPSHHHLHGAACVHGMYFGGYTPTQFSSFPHSSSPTPYSRSPSPTMATRQRPAPPQNHVQQGKHALGMHGRRGGEPGHCPPRPSQRLRLDLFRRATKRSEQQRLPCVCTLLTVVRACSVAHDR